MFPRRIDLEIERDWPVFRDYANDPAMPLREKTQAFERARRQAHNL